MSEALTSSGRRAGGRGVVGALSAIAIDIKLAHSVFALPFAVLGAFLARTPMVAGDAPVLAGPVGGAGSAGASGGAWGGTSGREWWEFLGKLGLVVACMVLARTWAMLVNRLADRRLDAENERTKRRAFASGRAGPLLGWGLAAACAAGFGGVCYLFLVLYANPWPLYLGGIVLAWLALYSYTKRFTAACHLVLGVSLAMSPIAAAIAVRPEALLATPTLWWLAGFVALWVAGFDIVYAIQDEAFDRARGLFSIPAAIGAHGAVWAARMLHGMSMVALLAAWTSDVRLGWLTAFGVLAVFGLLLIEHMVLWRSARGEGATPRLHAFFFTLNGVVSVAIGAAGCADLLAKPIG
ncbi:MAG: 4-hydroxybenzoate octaprenyltransferase [Planctomycetota bacterium]|nr:4-hydroxybenzoate octaprenyltransferase [Planctomycetota bacterium]